MNEELKRQSEEYRDQVLDIYKVAPATSVMLGWLFAISAQLQNIEDLLKEQNDKPSWDHSRTINIGSEKLTPDQIAMVEEFLSDNRR